jgi:hypothetical protein
MHRRIALTIVSLFCLLCTSGCELFYPDAQVENPEIVKNDDPFAFAGLLQNTQERFSKLNYEDLFNERFTYFGNDNQVFSRRQELDRLDQIERLFDDIQVTWDTTAASNEPSVFNKSDTISLYRKYEVTTRKQVPDPTDTLKSILVEKKHFGTSRLDLVFHTFKNTWCILRWYDEQSQTGLTFFHPEYQE